MKKPTFIILLLLSVIVLSCKNEANKEKLLAQNETALNTVQDEMLVGKISRLQLENNPYKEWFIENYKEYQTDSAEVKKINELLTDVKITTFMGTWCGDSQREVPAFYKIIDQAEMNFENVSLIAVKRDKTTPLSLEKGLDITNVPTFIFTKDGKELGRIVEYPIETLEKDILKILEGKPYSHAYAE
ncbi:MAG: thioredoxin family protein [Leeuwenhoekiella sp.]